MVSQKKRGGLRLWGRMWSGAGHREEFSRDGKGQGHVSTGLLGASKQPVWLDSKVVGRVRERG